MRRAKFTAESVTYVASALLTYEGGPAELQQVPNPLPTMSRLSFAPRGQTEASVVHCMHVMTAVSVHIVPQSSTVSVIPRDR